MQPRHVEAGRKVVCIEAAAGAVGTPRWQSALRRAIGMTPGARTLGRGRVGRASPSRCGFGPVTKQRLGLIEQWAGSGSAQYFSNYLKTPPIL
jgi:hypothetical protein